MGLSEGDKFRNFFVADAAPPPPSCASSLRSQAPLASPIKGEVGAGGWGWIVPRARRGTSPLAAGSCTRHTPPQPSPSRGGCPPVIAAGSCHGLGAALRPRGVRGPGGWGTTDARNWIGTSPLMGEVGRGWGNALRPHGFNKPPRSRSPPHCRAYPGNPAAPRRRSERALSRAGLRVAGSPGHAR